MSDPLEQRLDQISDVTVRSARLEDAAQLARLFGQLGDPQTADALRGPLENVLTDPRADVLVAETGGALVGAATYFFVPVAHDSHPWCRITTLVVDEARRGHGIGRMLVAAAETVARKAGCSRIEATSALHRHAAHRFYERLGYGRTSAHFLKRLEGPARLNSQHEPSRWHAAARVSRRDRP